MVVAVAVAVVVMGGMKGGRSSRVLFFSRRGWVFLLRGEGELGRMGLEFGCFRGGCVAGMWVSWCNDVEVQFFIFCGRHWIFLKRLTFE